MKSSIIVRSAAASDLRAIVEGNSMMAIESEGKRLDEAVLTRGVRRALEDPLRGRYLVAECDGRVVGQLMVTQEWSDWRDGWFWWIQSVYVAKNFRRKGVYRRLYEHLRDEASNTAGVCGLRLYVERENEPALATYQSLGMVDAGYNLYEIVWPSAADDRG
ncbi:MAG: GNAT family N-acetyltransferase [Phycisphaerae bacterium]